MDNLKQWYYPSSVAEALAILVKNPKKSVLVAGATAIAPDLAKDAEHLVSISGLGLNGVTVEEDRSITIGATTTVRELLESTRKAALSPVIAKMLGKAALGVGSHLIRNVVTIGGNVVQLYPWSDLPPALYALDARFTVEKSDGSKRELSASDFFRKHPKTHIQGDELVTQITIPPQSEGLGGAFEKFARTEVDHALANVATTVQLDDDGRCKDVHIVVSALVSRPIRITVAEDALRGEKPTEEKLREVAALARQNIQPMSDYRASADYRSQLVEALIVRCLEEAALQAGHKE